MHQKNYIPTLDGWRALSVIGVILYHGRSIFFPEDRWLGRLLLRVCSHGYLGVDVFFAISGFLICTLLLQEYERFGDIDLRRFYIRRCFRILPPYYVALLGICLTATVGAIHMNYADLPSCFLFYRNYKALGVDTQGGFYTAHFWSLAIEEHFYLIWPMLLIAVTPKRAGKVAFLLALLVFGWRSLQGHLQLPQSVLETRTDTRMDALLWGCLAAIYFPVIRRCANRTRFSQLWLPVVATLVFAVGFHAPGFSLLSAILLPALIVSTVLQPGSVLSRFLEWEPVRWVGSLSYSLYLWQELFLPEVATEKSLGIFRHLQQGPWNIFAILLCAICSRYLIEIPMTRLGHRISSSLPGLVVPSISAAAHRA